MKLPAGDANQSRSGKSRCISRVEAALSALHARLPERVVLMGYSCASSNQKRRAILCSLAQC